MNEVLASVTGRAGTDRLSALVASRICHDLVGPLGAISNGLELLALLGSTSAEGDLITESIASATARLRYFRIAYGLCGPGQMTARAEITSILTDMEAGGRISYEWEPVDGCRREEVRAIFLLIQCIQTAMPKGGHIRVRKDEADWIVSGDGSTLRFDDPCWLFLRGQGANPPGSPPLVQFALLPEHLGDLGRVLFLTASSSQFTARISMAGP